MYDKIFKRSFRFWQKLGLSIVLNHFYSPIPDLNELKNDIWERVSELKGIKINENRQLNLLKLFKDKFKVEYDQIPFKKKKEMASHEYYLNNEFFGPISGEILYCMIRFFKPSKIIEIGSGFSTYLMAQTILKNMEEDNNYTCSFISIDPYPNKILKQGIPGLGKLIPKKVQEIPIKYFTNLDENDILFIDSSHVIKIGGDVQYEYLEIFPRLKKGVIIHVHDILLPAEYHKKWIFKDKLFWNEQYLLQAFLCFNPCFEILFAGSYLHHFHPEALKASFNSYEGGKRFSTSFWMKKIE